MTLLARLNERPRLRIFFWAFMLALACGVLEAGEPLEDTIKAGRDLLRAKPASGEIVVVGVDDRTGARFGGFNVSREVDARLLEGLFKLGARSVYFDRLYADPADPEGDRHFIDVLRKHRGRVFLGAASPEVQTGMSIQTLPNEMFRRAAEFRSLNGKTTPLRLSAILTDSDVFDGKLVPSISASLAHFKEYRAGYYRPDWSIQMATVPSYSALDVIDGKLPARALAGKDVLVGWTSPTMRDKHQILSQGEFPGVFLHVIGAETLKTGRPVWLGWWPAFALACALACMYLGRRLPITPAAFAAATISAFMTLPLLFDAWLIEVDIVPGLLMFGLVVVRLHLLRRVEATRRTHPSSGLPNMIALDEDGLPPGTTLIAAKVRNIAEIAASFRTNVEGEIIKELARRIRVSGDVQQVYHGEDALVWLTAQPVGQEMTNHLMGLHKLSSQPIRIGEREIDLLLAFGVDADGERPLSSRVASAILSADEAARSNDVWKLYDPQRLHQAAWQLSLMSRLSHAMQSGEIWVAYQPKVDMVSRRIIGAEALARWTHPTAGPIGPDQFIAAAEAHNRIGELTAFVLDRALADLAVLREAGHDIGIAVNLSSQLLTEASLVGRIGTMLVRHRVPPTRLTLEITETGELLSSAIKVQTMERIASTGVQISIDDYGTGNATLEYLSRLPSQEVKIDRTFISDLDRNAQNLILVRSTMEMAHRLGRRVVAEGVENEAVMRVLKDLGCDIAQGYLLGRPLPLAELRRLLDSDEPRPRLKVVIS